MDQKTRKNIQEKLKKRTMQLPPIFQEFLKENQKTLSLSSRYEYAKDFHLFSDYLRDTYAEDVTDQLIIHLEKRDYLNFLQKVYRHTRSIFFESFSSLSLPNRSIKKRDLTFG